MALAHDPAETVRVLISGASGLIGTPLKERLRIRGHDVHVLVRREPHDATEHRFDPETGGIDQGIIDHVDAVINYSATLSVGAPPTAFPRARIAVRSGVGFDNIEFAEHAATPLTSVNYAIELVTFH